MKNFFLLLLFICTCNLLSAQTLISYGSNTVSADEFLRAYNKNKVQVKDKEKAIREYIELYTNFKLKVQAAKELRLDTLQQIRLDIENFRTQVQENYMNDETEREMLVQEAIERSLKELHVIHFALDVSADSVKDLSLITSTFNDLRNGKDISSLNSRIKVTDVGYITAFTLPYNFENVVYKLKKGEISAPYRTTNRWHIFKLIDTRQSTGKWKVSQILFSVPPSASDLVKNSIVKRADSIYRLLKNGLDFSTAATRFSEDKLTYQNGGELPEFTAGKYDAVFENEVLKLKSDGDISRPFLTPFGYHIVKRIAHVPTDKSDPAVQFDIRQKVLKDNRIEISKERFAKKIAGKTGMKRTTGVKDAELLRYADSVMKNPVPENASRFPISNKEIIRFNKGSIKGSDWLKYVVEYKSDANNYKGESNKALLDKYLAFAGQQYYREHLEEYNADFKYQMGEFREGNMLFEIMERNVWGMATIDSAGLRKYYLSNRNKYMWPASADVLIFNCTNEAAAEEVISVLKKGREWKQVAEAYNASAQADSGRYEIVQLLGENYINVSAGDYSKVVKNADGTAMFMKFIKIYQAGEQRTFEEAKGLVINDYQTVLEEKWLATLKKKYPVKINESVVKQILAKK